jgi:hydrogenase maturation factor
VIRAQIAEIVGQYAILEFGGIARIVPINELPQQACQGDVVILKNRKLVLAANQRHAG